MLSHKTKSVGGKYLDARFDIQLDSKDRALVKLMARPPKGWIKAIREALGMSAAQLAKRVGVSQPVITNIESSEVAGTIKLATLERVAGALNCRVVYALIPNEPLQTMVTKRARQVAEGYLAGVEHTMRLENQSVDDKTAHERHLNTLLAEIDMRRLWD